MGKNRHNGNTEVKIQLTENIRGARGTGFFQAGDPAPEASVMAFFLNRALDDWKREHPNYIVRAALGMVSQGNTTGIHVWFDVEGDAP